MLEGFERRVLGFGDTLRAEAWTARRNSSVPTMLPEAPCMPSIKTAPTSGVCSIAVCAAEMLLYSTTTKFCWSTVLKIGLVENPSTLPW